MSFDLRQLDNLIERLEKAVTPGSPPVSVQGKLGVWRTLRGYRVLIEMRPSTGGSYFGKYNAGKILIGPPSLVGNDLQHVNDKTWAALSGQGIKAVLPSNPSDDGIHSLKQSIHNSLEDSDTRNDAIKEEDDPAKLIQIARSAGFTDGEISQAFKGKVFTSALGPSKEDKPEEPAKPKLPENVTEFPKPKKSPTAGLARAVGGEHLVEAAKMPGLFSSDKKQEMVDNLREAAEKQSSALLKSQTKALADGLETGDFKVSQVQERLKELVSLHTKQLQQDVKATTDKLMSKETVDKLHDKAVSKKAAKAFEDNVAAVQKSGKSESEAIALSIEDLANKVNSAKVSKNLKALASESRKHGSDVRSAYIQLMRILRVLLAFIPGVG